jgi:hypothetical protein
MAESEPVEGVKTKNGNPRKVGHLKMIVIDDLKSETITPVVEETVSGSSIIDSDDSISSVKLKNIVEEHRPQVIPKNEIEKTLP